MNTLNSELKISIRAMVAFTVVLGLAYPLAMTAFAQLSMPNRANGSVIEHHGSPVGSALIGQDFAGDERFFQSRPSITGYATMVTYFPNLGPNSSDLRDSLAGHLRAYLELEGPHNPGLTAEQVPTDAVTQSASGVDPAISIANARIQAARVAAVRSLPIDRVNELIDQSRETKLPLLLGESAVNVLGLNLALEAEGSK